MMSGSSLERSISSSAIKKVGTGSIVTSLLSLTDFLTNYYKGKISDLNKTLPSEQGSTIKTVIM